ncbi:hypothetical protein PTSG_10705 [Salpingoeca rosetta]|uniref:Uncharacterized protein n=1 Tax=Salpingoeca rosetta (strain ATCC 50818 / BSB-021) TaxID=946362 RepID=F2UQ53_SALR5|nr:uncharacterized protein PTSG_10705 [Salpingoeca rosetta]EGD79721.1 hypothetical protein PTSG_10705 [Salpingoeca rosetta]|eukprot:XP_004988670.1 hypothetical protein PTSG_10705 [Salpingoeca rosetta]
MRALSLRLAVTRALLLVVVVVVVVPQAVLAAADAGGASTTPKSQIVGDDVGNLHISTGDVSGRVYVNGVDVLRELELLRHVTTKTCRSALRDGVDTATLTTSNTAQFKWNGGVLASNGNVYAAPDRADSILVIEPDTQTVREIALPANMLDGMWYTLVEAGDNHLYGMPVRGGALLMLSLEDEVVSSKALSPILDTFWSWSGGVVAGKNNTIIYGIPWGSPVIMVFDVLSGGFSTIDLPKYNGAFIDYGPTKWARGVLADNGYIYAMPASADAVLAISTLDHTVSYLDVSPNAAFLRSGPGDNWKWYGGVLAGNGLIYGIPYKASAVLVIDPSTQQTSMVPLPLDVDGWWTWSGGALGRDGRVYAIARDAPYPLVIDPDSSTNTAVVLDAYPLHSCTFVAGAWSSTGSCTGDAPTLWSDGVAVGDGTIVGIPFHTTSVLTIDTTFFSLCL